MKSSGLSACRVAAPLLALLAASHASGQCVNAMPGPDVIVGDIPDVDHYTTAGAVNGKRAYAFGTTSCNLGQIPLRWDDTTNLYPVISQNIYRLKNGRLEQLGQAWLKHGWCALQGTVCCSCQPGGTCDDLYPGCSDPYSSGLNGSQGGLGAKFEIDAAAGYIPLNWTGTGVVETGDNNQVIYKRLQASQQDLANPGAVYFFASMYVQPQDSEFGNDNNNQSYRRVTINSTTFNATLNDVTQRTKNAIYAWRDHGLGINTPDTSVMINTVLDPSLPPHNDSRIPGVADGGMFLVGNKVTDLGNGMHRYEYAVQNHNNDRAGGAFRVALPAGATVTNAEFRGVPYHSGEPWSNAPWVIDVSTSEIVFRSPQTHAENPNTNALRWDTLYNFRFDCNVAPVNGAVNIDLFRPGAAGEPSTLQVASRLPAGASANFAAPNDVCANAFGLQGSTTVAFSTSNANTDGPDEPGAACNTGGYTNIGGDVWYRWLSGAAGTVTISTCGSSFDTKIGVYASCPSGSNAVLACNDDASCGAGSVATFTCANSTEYWIRVGGRNGATGQGMMTISAPSFVPPPPPPPPPPPSNDICATSAQFVADGGIYTGSTTLASNDGSATCGSSSTARDVWFRYRPQTGGAVVFDTCGSGFNTVLSVRAGGCTASQVTCNDNSTVCGAGSTNSRLQITAQAGTLYYIRLAGFNNAAGEYTLRVTGGGGLLPPANDTCATRASAVLGANAFSTVDANSDGPAHAACSFSGNDQISNDIWYSFTAAATGTMTVATCAASFDSKLAVYSGTGCSNFESRLVACNDAGCGDDASVSMPVTAGQSFTFRVGGVNGAWGTGTLNVSIAVPPSCSWQSDGCYADFNNDDAIDGDDVIGFFGAWDAGNACTDANGDSGVDGDDIVAFFASWDVSGNGVPGC